MGPTCRWLAAAAATLIACAGGCSSAPVRLSEARTAAVPARLLDGVYRAEVGLRFRDTDGAPARAWLTMYLAAKRTDNAFVANTRPGVAWSLIGGVRGMVGPIVAPWAFPGGVILVWSGMLPSDGEPGQGAIQLGGLSFAVARTRLYENATASVHLNDGREIVRMRLEPSSPSMPPLSDYTLLGERLGEVVRERWFDPSMTSAVRSYAGDVRRVGRSSRDDAEFVFGAVSAGRDHLRPSMPIMFRVSPAPAAPDEPTAPSYEIKADERNGIVTLRVFNFFSADDVDEAMAAILAMRPRGLVLDLGSTPGATLAALRTVCWLTPKPVDLGGFFGPRARQPGLAGNLEAFTRMEIASASDVRSAERELDRLGAGSLIAMPVETPYAGPVAIVAGPRTGTTAEILTHVLAASGRAMVFGERTAGRTVLSAPYPIGQGWTAWIASYDYVGPSGEHLTGKGVEPTRNAPRGRESAAKAWILEQTESRPSSGGT